MAQLGRITKELQRVSMSLRMVPIRGVFQKMARVVRDVGAKQNKKVQFVTSGEDTELDRGVVEELNDPLLHMIGPGRSFAEIREYLEHATIEGIVWHHPDGRMVKIKRKDFGFKG